MREAGEGRRQAFLWLGGRVLLEVAEAPDALAGERVGAPVALITPHAAAG